MLSANEKHFSNTEESLKLTEEISTPYVEKECMMLDLGKDGQMTDPVIQKLKQNHIKVARVPPNMTNLFQPLDLTVNGSAKAFMKKKFTEWYSCSIAKQLDEGKAVEDIDAELKSSIFKLLHAEWIKELYNYMTSEEGHGIISNGCKAAFITGAILKGKKGLEPLNPFFTVDPLLNNDDQINEEVQSNQDNAGFFARRFEDESDDNDDDDDWEFEGEEVNNIFDIINYDES